MKCAYNEKELWPYMMQVSELNVAGWPGHVAFGSSVCWIGSS